MDRSGHYLQPDEFHQLNEIDYIGVRGPLSKQILLEYNIESTITGDTALILNPTNVNEQHENRIAVTLRDFTPHNGGRKWTNSGQYINVIRKFCREKSNKFKFIFVPLKPPDIPLHLDLAQEIPNAEFENHCTVPNVDSVINTYAECDLVISERLHGSVLSSCSFTPFISLEYRPKTADFAKSIGMSEYNIRIDNISLLELQTLLSKIQSNDIQDNLINGVEKREI